MPSSKSPPEMLRFSRSMAATNSVIVMRRAASRAGSTITCISCSRPAKTIIWPTPSTRSNSGLMKSSLKVSRVVTSSGSSTSASGSLISTNQAMALDWAPTLWMTGRRASSG